MAGHSKWSNIKRKKEKTDAQKAKAFTKVTREIIVAVKAGGGDPDANFQLRLAIQRAKAVNMPNENINRAIKRALGSTDADQFEEIIYEGYGPAGVAFLVQTLSDNRNRTASEMRYIFSRNNGNLGETGCVAWLFEQKGVITVPKEKWTWMKRNFELALEAEPRISGMKMIITKLSPVFPNWNRCATTWKGKFRSKKPNWPICPRIRSPYPRRVKAYLSWSMLWKNTMMCKTSMPTLRSPKTIRV